MEIYLMQHGEAFSEEADPERSLTPEGESQIGKSALACGDGSGQSAPMRALAITSVKNEGPFLLEWLAHHRAVGFTDFLVFSNDCDDGTDAMLDRLAELGWLTHLPNPGPWKEGPQWAALKRADAHPLVAQADWIAVIDVDVATYVLRTRRPREGIRNRTRSRCRPWAGP